MRDNEIIRNLKTENTISEITTVYRLADSKIK